MTLQASEKGLKQYQDHRFGMFIHWGLYSLGGKDAWLMHDEQIPAAEYEKLASKFNPTHFNADEWVKLAADAGQKYIVITSRHHDGFSMFNTALSDYKVTNSPFRRDPLAELANACAKRGDVQLGFYSSLLDWHHPGYRFRKESGMAWQDYLGFLHGQVRELCTNFGPLACIWFDGEWPRDPYDPTREYFKAGGSFEYEKLYNSIHALQPDAVVINNRHDIPLPGEDVQNFEQDLPGENHNPIVTNLTQITNLPLEVCMTINESWGIRFGDKNHKSTRRLLHILARSAAAGANLLLNIGPTAEGDILPAQRERLLEIGSWLRKYGPSIYNTRAGQLQAAGCVSTSAGNNHYLVSLEYLSDVISVKNLPETVSQASLLDGTPLELQIHGKTAELYIPSEARDTYATVIHLS